MWTFAGKVMSLLFKTLSRFVIAFFPRSKCLLVSWLQSPSTVILETKKINSVTASTFPLLLARKWWDWIPRSSFCECSVLSQLFHSHLSPSLRSSLVCLPIVALEWYYLHIWCWYFSQQSWFQLMLLPAWHFSWCTLHISYISRVTKYSLDVLLSQFLTSLFFHVQF